MVQPVERIDFSYPRSDLRTPDSAIAKLHGDHIVWWHIRVDNTRETPHRPFALDAMEIKPILFRQDGVRQTHSNRYLGGLFQRKVVAADHPRVQVDCQAQPQTANRLAMPVIHDDQVDSQLFRKPTTALQGASGILVAFLPVRSACA